MDNFVINNFNLIKELNKLYEKGVDIKAIHNYIKNQTLKYNASSYARFRVFLDSCLIVLNSERVRKIYCGYFSYKSYINNFIANNKDILSTIKNSSPMIQGNNDIKMFYSDINENLSEWDQICIIRNAFAHSQFGNFVIKSDAIVAFGVYNKDNGKTKKRGFVVEPIFHEVVKHYFSNYSYGLLYQYTCFLNYSLKESRICEEHLFYNITLNHDGKKTIENFQNNILSELAEARDSNEWLVVIEKYRDCLNIVENDIDSLIDTDKLKRVLVALGYDNEGKNLYFSMKLFLSTNETVSNFIAHMMHITDTIYKYRLGGMQDSELDDILMKLSEDANDKFAFDFGIVFIELINLIIRIADDTYESIEYGTIDISYFEFDSEAADKYFDKMDRCEERDKHIKYILTRIRNSVMHGRFNLELADEDYNIIFIDTYNKREEKITISFSNLKKFLSQSELYDTMNRETNILWFCNR